MIKTSKNFSSQISLTDKGLPWALGKGSERDLVNLKIKRLLNNWGYIRRRLYSLNDIPRSETEELRVFIQNTKLTFLVGKSQAIVALNFSGW